MHQLEIVHDQEIETAFHHQAARLAAHLDQCDAGCIVDVDIGLGEPRHRLADALPLLVVDVPRAQSLLVHASIHREQARHELLPAHLQTEDGDGVPEAQRRVVCKGELHRRFAHSGPRGQDDEVGFLQAASHLVEIGETGRDADDAVAPLVQVVELVEVLLQRHANRLEVVAQKALADVEYQLFGLVKRRGCIRLVVGHCGDLPRRGDQPAQNRRALDNVPVVFHIRAGRHLIGEAADIANAADIVKLATARQLIGEGDEIRGWPVSYRSTTA